MGPKKANGASASPKKVQRVITIETKKEIIEKHERGIRVSDLCTAYNMSSSTICTILKKKEEIKKVQNCKGISILSKKRVPAVDEMETLLLGWIRERQVAGDYISESMKYETAKAIYSDIVDKYPVGSSDREFRVSRGWFAGFKKRNGIDCVGRHREAESSDHKFTQVYVERFERLVSHLQLCPNQVFNCDETGLFWKKLPRRTYITKEEKNKPGHKLMKDRLTLLLCANTSGDFKVKPMLVYHSETPRIFSRNKVSKSRLGVVWKSNPKAWVTRQLFVDWIREVFCPSVKKYFEEKSLPLKALLVMDNAPAHPTDLEDELADFPWLTIEFLPPNTTPLLQPMDQQVITNFQKLYTKALLEKCFEMTSESELTLAEFWKNHFHILSAVGLIVKSWENVTMKTLRSAWKNLWPAIIQQKDLEDFEAEIQDDPVVQDIVSLSESLGLEVDSHDVEELVQEHSNELTAEELQELVAEQQREVAEAVSGEEAREHGRKEIPTSAIKEMLGMWVKVRSFLEEHHPDKEVTNRNTDLLNDMTVGYFRQIIKRRQRQTSMDMFVKRLKTDKSEEWPSEYDIVPVGEPRPGPGHLSTNIPSSYSPSLDAEDVKTEVWREFMA